MNVSILICDGNVGVSKVTKRLLEGNGYEVDVRSNGPEALEFLEKRRKKGLLISEVILPAPMSGFELAAQAKALIPELRVLFMATLAPPRVALSSHPHVFPVLTKPVLRDILLRTVKGLMGDRALQVPEGRFAVAQVQREDIQV